MKIRQLVCLLGFFLAITEPLANAHRLEYRAYSSADHRTILSVYEMEEFVGPTGSDWQTLDVKHYYGVLPHLDQLKEVNGTYPYRRETFTLDFTDLLKPYYEMKKNPDNTPVEPPVGEIVATPQGLGIFCANGKPKQFYPLQSASKMTELVAEATLHSLPDVREPESVWKIPSLGQYLYLSWNFSDHPVRLYLGAPGRLRELAVISDQSGDDHISTIVTDAGTLTSNSQTGMTTWTLAGSQLALPTEELSLPKLMANDKALLKRLVGPNASDFIPQPLSHPCE